MLDASPTVAPDPAAQRRQPLRPLHRTGVLAIVALATAGVAAAVVALSATTLVGTGRAALAVAGGFLVVISGARLFERRKGRRLDLGLLLSIVWLVALGLAALLADSLPLTEGRNPSNALTEQAMLPPDLLTRHPFGTDSQALDVLAQLLFGARVSIIVAGGAVLISLLIGGALGVCAGYFRGRVEAAIGFVTDSMLAFPALILLLGLVSVLKPSILNVTVALGVLGTPGTVRLARASTLAVSSREYVTASRTLGARRIRIILGEVVPNVVPSLIAYSFVAVGFLIVAEASLSFLGLGIQRPNPTWGNLISQGQAVMDTQPWLVAFPSFFLFLTVLSSNYIGQRLQQKWSL